MRGGRTEIRKLLVAGGLKVESWLAREGALVLLGDGCLSVSLAEWRRVFGTG